MHIQKALGYPELEYAHLPLVLGSDKKRLSKRNAATSLEEYQEKGYLDSAILNTLARLGWSKGDKEIFYLEDLIRDFEITEIQKAGAIFDITKLDYLNTNHMANLSHDNFIKELKPYIAEIDIDLDAHKKPKELVESLRSSASSLKGVALNIACYFNEINEYDLKAINKFIGDSPEILEDLKENLSNVSEWNEESLDLVLNEYRQIKELSVPKINQPIRIALTGSTNSPSLGLTLSLFEKDEAIKRIGNLIAYINKSS